MQCGLAKATTLTPATYALKGKQESYDDVSQSHHVFVTQMMYVKSTYMYRYAVALATANVASKSEYYNV